jgi:nucleotide-binding universal stress UspA family protein
MTVAELNTLSQTQTTGAAFRHILVATDFSEASKRALLDASALAQDNNAQLSVVHVLQPDRQWGALENPPELDLERIDAEQRIKSLVEELGPEQKIDSTLVKHGPVAERRWRRKESTSW